MSGSWGAGEDLKHQSRVGDGDHQDEVGMDDGGEDEDGSGCPKLIG